MKIRTTPSFQYVIIDMINNRSWQFIAVSTTLLAITGLWTIGVYVMQKLI